MGNLLASSLSWYAFARCHGNSKLRCYFLLFLLKKKLLLSFPQFGTCKTKFMKLKGRSSDVYRSVLQSYIMQPYFYGKAMHFGKSW